MNISKRNSLRLSEQIVFEYGLSAKRKILLRVEKPSPKAQIPNFVPCHLLSILDFAIFNPLAKEESTH